MSWIIRFENTYGINLPSESSCHMRGERQALENELNEKPLPFVIFDRGEENVIAEGIYAGSVSDMDYPLEMVRIYAKDKDVEPIYINYLNGVSYQYEETISAVVPSTKIKSK